MKLFLRGRLDDIENLFGEKDAILLKIHFDFTLLEEVYKALFSPAEGGSLNIKFKSTLQPF